MCICVNFLVGVKRHGLESQVGFRVLFAELLDQYLWCLRNAVHLSVLHLGFCRVIRFHLFLLNCGS